MTLDEETKKLASEVTSTVFNREAGWSLKLEKTIAYSFKSYLKEFLESVKLEPLNSFDNNSSTYNQALSDQESKIAEELTKHGL